VVRPASTLLAVSDDDRMRLLGRAIYKRRDQLGLTRADVRARGGPGEATLGRLENPTPGTPLPRGRTLTKLDDALNWAPGSAASVLEGRPPTEMAGEDRRVTTQSGPALAMTTFAVDVELLGRLMSAARAALPRATDPTTGAPYADTAPLFAAIHDLSAAYATEVLERASASGGIPDTLALAYNDRLSLPVEHDDTERHTEQLYRRWIAGLAGDLHPETVIAFQDRLRAKMNYLRTEATQ
jgi:hypothetical protein